MCESITHFSGSGLINIKFEIENFKSAEHLFTALMAFHHNRRDLLPFILKARDGYDAKRIARRIKTDEAWDTDKIEIVKRVIKLKFDQDDNLRDRLLNLKGHLYEATKDVTFACGLVLSQLDQITKDSIPGKNILGDQICEYRDNILKQK